MNRERTPSINQPTPDLLHAYAAALAAFVEHRHEAALHRAYEIGRQLLAEGLGILETTSLHQEALLSVLAGQDRARDPTGTLGASAEFLAEALSPFEISHRGYREANAALRGMNELLEEQARRIAQAMHDEAGQLLASVHVALGELARGLAPAAQEQIRRVRELLDDVHAHLRQLSHELRPPMLDDLGLVPALRFLANGITDRTTLEVKVECHLTDRLPRSIETAIYRVVQEALTNIIKHANATRAEIEVRQDGGQVQFRIGDNGVGFDPAAASPTDAPRGLGLIGMRERIGALGGRLDINQPPEGGTELRGTIPIPAMT